MIEQIYLSLILIGTTIGAVLLALWFQARKAGQIHLALIRMNEEGRNDSLYFLRNAWPLLEKAGFKGLFWEMNWFGVNVPGYFGEEAGQCIRRTVHIAEMRLSLRLYLKDKRSERRYFVETLAETFVLLARADMLIKAQATDAAFSHMSKLTLFLQHDMKNIAQFIQLMADQLETVPDGKEQKLFEYLSASAPVLRVRADRIVNTLTLTSRSQNAFVKEINLNEKLSEICRLHQLFYQIEGTAQVRGPEGTIDSIFDNIVKNYKDISQYRCIAPPLLKIGIEQKEGCAEISITAPEWTQHTQSERLFEPFWSSNPHGLGIGLYQTRQMLTALQSEISTALTQEGNLVFTVSLAN